VNSYEGLNVLMVSG